MKNKRHQLLSISLALVLTVTFGALPKGSEKAFAASSVQQKIDEAAKKQKEALERINKSKKEKEAVLAEQQRLDHEINVLTAELDEIDNIIGEADRNIAEKEKEIAGYEEQIASNEKDFRARLRAMDETNVASYIDLLLDSQSFSDFLARVETVKEISEHDQQIIDEMVNLKTGVETSRDEIVKARDEQKEARALVDGKKGELDKKLAQKKAAVESLENDIEKDEKAYQEAKDAQESLKKSLASSLSSSSGGGPVYSGGEFCFPAPSYTYVSSEFGYRIHPISGTRRYHSGLDLAAPYATNVLAAADGTVRMAGWNGGYGNCVVIDHGGGRATLYGHNSSLLVSAGQRVTKGQVIAKIGSTGASTGNHCHFEVLINGQAVNPRPYLGM